MPISVPKFSNFKFLLITITLGLFVYSCDQPKSKTSPISETSTLDTISLLQFKKWNINWQSHWNTDSIVYFTMPLSDLQNTLDEVGVDSARFYLGFSTLQNRAHLTLVGVDQNGNDMIGGDNHIYDVSVPCPPACGNAENVSGKK